MLGVKYKTASQNSFHKQSGAALLAFMLIIVAGSAYYLLEKFRTNAIITQNHEATGIALRAAKEALIGYAVTYPDKVNAEEGPGYLLCPDIDNDGDAETICALGGANDTIGRLPYETLELPDLRDSSGERLWYTLSENFRNNPKIVPLNSESPSQAELTVDGTNDIVAIIFAPGAPVGTQDRAANSNAVANYLEDDNSNLDTSFVTTAGGDFNDRIIVITRQELMQAVEKRVTGEIDLVLSNYITTQGAYPWLSPFADPKVLKNTLYGEHNCGACLCDDSATLIDITKDFSVWNIQAGDKIWNISNKSVGEVNAIGISDYTCLTVTYQNAQISVDIAALELEGDFDIDDEYFIYPAARSNVYTSLATNSNNSQTLEDSGSDFTELNVESGDVVDNISDGSSGVVDAVSANSITFTGLTGGTDNDFDTNDEYRIRSQFGQVTGVTNNLTIDDSKNNFNTMGIMAGDLIINHTDGSIGLISSVVDSDTLMIDELRFGEDNIFETNDYYSLPRNNTNNNTREGLLAFHEIGKHFPTSFDIDLNISLLSNGDVSFDTVNYPAVDATYSAALETHIRNYYAAGFNQTSSVSFDDGVCLWLAPEIAECFAPYDSENINIEGTVTSGTNTPIITDTNADFVTDGVKRGDIVQNYDDEFSLSPSVSGTADEGGTTGTTTAGSSGLSLEDTGRNFIILGINIGDTVNNTTDGSTGAVEAITATTLTVSSLSGGTDNQFENGDNYEVIHPELYDATATFVSDGIEPYNYMVFNTTTGVRAVITEVIDETRLVAVELTNQSSPITFTTTNNYTIYTPGIVVVESRDSATQITTTRTGSYNPDFDLLGSYEEYYRVLPAANSYSGTATAASSGTTLVDSTADFINEGITIGDIIENVSDGSFGEITAVTSNTIGVTQLYGGTENDFDNTENYVVYHDYVYSRTHEFHALFSGDVVASTLSEKRVRDVCLNYTNADCINIDANEDFTGNGGKPLITVRDFELDGVTEIGRAYLTPGVNSEGALKVSNIDYYLWETNNELPAWFMKNKWHQLVYVAYSNGDRANGGATCTVAGTDCLTLNNSGDPTNNKRALIVNASESLATQDRTSGNLSDYLENENNDQGDDVYQTGNVTNTFNDQINILGIAP